ncbi:unnamed protein product, partial [Pylaiella littoralis]
QHRSRLCTRVYTHNDPYSLLLVRLIMSDVDERSAKRAKPTDPSATVESRTPETEDSTAAASQVDATGRVPASQERDAQVTRETDAADTPAAAGNESSVAGSQT